MDSVRRNNDDPATSDSLPGVNVGGDFTFQEQSVTVRFVRLLDIVLSLLLLLLGSPVLIVVAATILVLDGRPVFFTQERTGRHERIFRIHKFRTLRNTLDGAISSTRLGQFLRKTSLDELPQLVNILRGEMSFVGPRPLLPEYLAYFTETERLRFRVRPGLTGLAQISGRNAMSWDEKLSCDVQFVSQFSVRHYLRILAATPAVVLRRRGAAATWNEEPRLDLERADDSTI